MTKLSWIGDQDVHEAWNISVDSDVGWTQGLEYIRGQGNRMDTRPRIYLWIKEK